MKRQESELMNIGQCQLRQFLRVCVFGTMDTDASNLTNQQQQHLFNILERIHKQTKIDAKGIWGIISFAFKNRSGLILMTMFNNSQVNITEILHKKAFLKDIQFLESPNFNINNFHKILQIAGVDSQYFYEKFVQWKKQIKTAQIFQQNIPNIVLNENKLYEQDQYDSEPDTKHFVDLRYIDEQQTIYRKFSMFPPMIKMQLEQSRQGQLSDDTISITNLKRRIQKNVKQKNKKKKKAKRPDPKKKKIKLIKELKNKQMSVLKFAKQKKQRLNFKRAYNMMKSMRNQNILNLTPPSKHKNIIDQTGYISTKRSYRRNKVLKLGENQMDIELNIVSNESSFINGQSESESIQSRRHQDYYIDSEEENIEYVGELRKRLKKTQVESIIDLMNQQFTDHEIKGKQNENINQKIQNLEIKKIRFPINLDDLKNFNLINESDQYEFNVSKLWECIQAMSQKQKWSELRQIIWNKDKVQLEHVYKLLSLMTNNNTVKFAKGYIEPILKHKFTKMLSKIINQIINILYTSQTENQINSLFQSCKSMVVIIINCYNQNIISKDALVKVIFKTLTDIVRDIYIKNTCTDSLVDLPHPFQTVKKIFKIKLLQNDQKQTILLSLHILAHSFLKQILLLDNNYFFYINEFRNQIFQAYSQTIQNKPRFVRFLTDIYIKYQIPLLSKQDFNGLLKFLLKINLGESQPQFFNDIMPQITRSFIRQKQKQNKNFNHKPLLNYILESDFLNQCKKIIATEQSKDDEKKKALQIILRVYQVLMEFNNFHSELTIKIIIAFIQKIKLNEKYKKQCLLTVFRLLNSCYSLMFSEQFVSKKEQQRRQIMGMLQNNLTNFMSMICKKYDLISTTQSRFTNQNTKILQQIIYTFITQLMQNQIIQFQLEHYKLCIRLLLNYIVPLLIQSKRESEFISKVSQSFINKINLVAAMANAINEQIMNQEINYNQLSQMDDEMQILADRKVKATSKVKQMFAYIKNAIAQHNFNERQTQFITFIEMEKQHCKDYYRIQGILVALDLLKQSNITKLKLIAKYLRLHVKEIKIIKPNNQNLYKFSCKMLFQFLHGLINTVRLFMNGTDIERRVDEIGQSAKQEIYDILFLNFVCVSDKQQSKQIIDLIEKINKIRCFQNTDHILSKIKLPVEEQRGQKIYFDLSKFYNNFINHRFDDKMAKDKMINKFQITYFEPLINLYKSYEQLGWIMQKTHLGLNILNTFIFLMKMDANEEILKTYRAYFIMGNSQVYKGSISSQNNILRGLNLSKQSSFQTAQRIVYFFRTAYEKRMQNLQKTRENYLNYIVNISLQGINQNKDNSQYKFAKINYLIKALHNNCNTTQSLYQNKSVIQNCADNFSLIVCDYLLNRFIQQCMRIQQVKYNCIGYYFSLYRNYPKFSSVYVTILKNYHQKMDRIVKSKHNVELLSCENIQDAIKKYVVNKYCNFDELYSILWMRISYARRDKHSLKQLQQIIMKCMRFLQQKRESSIQQQLFTKYENLLKNIEDSSRMGNAKMSLEQLWCEHDAPQACKQFSNSFTSSFDMN